MGLRRGAVVMQRTTAWRILRGDKVVVVAGRDAGQTGMVQKVIRDPKFPRVVVEGLQLNKRHVKRTKDNPGGIVSVESPIHYSNVALVDPLTGGAVRATWRYLGDGTRVRITRGRLASGSIVPRPDVLTQRRKPRNSSAGGADTKVVDAQQATHTPGDLPSFLRQRLQRSQAAQAPAQGGQQARALHTAAAAAALVGSGSGLEAAAAIAATGLLGGRLRPLRNSSIAPLGRGFAASSLC